MFECDYVPYMGDPSLIMRPDKLLSFDERTSDGLQIKEGDVLRKTTEGHIILEKTRSFTREQVGDLLAEELAGLIDCKRVGPDEFSLKFAFVLAEENSLFTERSFDYDRSFFERVYYNLLEGNDVSKYLFLRLIEKHFEEKSFLLQRLIKEYVFAFYGPTKFTDFALEVLRGVAFDFTDDLSFLEKSLAERLYRFLKSSTESLLFEEYLRINLDEAEYAQFQDEYDPEQEVNIFDDFYKGLTEEVLRNIRTVFPFLITYAE